MSNERWVWSNTDEGDKIAERPQYTVIGEIGDGEIYADPFDESMSDDERGMIAAAAPALLAVAEAWQQWEADLILDRSAWDTPDGLPRIPQHLLDRMTELQQQRQAAIAKARGE